MSDGEGFLGIRIELKSKTIRTLCDTSTSQRSTIMNNCWRSWDGVGG